MFSWPTLELTEWERKFVRIYKTKDKPGVLNRRYSLTLNSQALPDSNLPTIILTDKVQIARRSRVYAISFSGNLDRWRLNISNASGTQYTNKTPRGQLDPIVSSLLPGSFFNALSLGGLVPPLVLGDESSGVGPAINHDPLYVTGYTPYPMLIDPNWVLMPNESLIFNGTPIPITFLGDKEDENPPLILNIGIHVWEFPLMGTTSTDNREKL